MLKRTVRCSLLLLLLTPSASAADEAPAWLKQAAAAPQLSYGKTTEAVVLLRDSRSLVEENGKITTTTYFAVRILSHEGRREAVARQVYQTDTSKVKEFQAWLIRPSGEVKKFGKDKVLDIALVENDVYNEVRMKAIFADEAAEAGAVFGYESVIEDKSVFTQNEWYFQRRGLPVVQSRMTLALPPGWHAESVTFNHAKIEPSVTNSTYVWELHDLPPIEEEPSSPDLTALSPRLAVSYYPPSEGKNENVQSFDNWTDVSRWLSRLADPQSNPDEVVASKARELAAHARTDFEKIAAIGRFVQSVQYISIQTGIGRGGGYRPHAASEVLAKSYGDCKDKANLMRAMLKAVGITSYPVAIYSGDPTYVRPEWASPQQFNHCVIGVKIGEETVVPTTVEHPSLGRLLIFDPTDEETPVGDLPDDEQGSFALVVAGDSGKLLRMPVTPPEANSFERTIHAALDPNGTLSATLQERSSGQPAVTFRREFHRYPRPEFVKIVEHWVTNGASNASVTKVQPTDDKEAGRFTLDVDFTAPRYGQLMQGRLLVFKPAIVSRRERLAFTSAERKYPMRLDAQDFSETAHIKLPEGFEVDELPDRAQLSAPFGSYAATYEVRNGELVFSRKFSVSPGMIPPEQYLSVRNFFERIRAAEQSPVVLIKK